MTEITIRIEDDVRHGRYVGQVSGLASEAELTFTHRGPGVVSADHVGAPIELRGTGVAGALVDRLVADARTKGFRIIPICPYVLARYAKHPEWRDAFTVGPGEKPKLKI